MPLTWTRGEFLISRIVLGTLGGPKLRHKHSCSLLYFSMQYHPSHTYPFHQQRYASPCMNTLSHLRVCAPTADKQANYCRFSPTTVPRLSRTRGRSPPPLCTLSSPHPTYGSSCSLSRTCRCGWPHLAVRAVRLRLTVNLVYVLVALMRRKLAVDNSSAQCDGEQDEALRCYRERLCVVGGRLAIMHMLRGTGSWSCRRKASPSIRAITGFAAGALRHIFGPSANSDPVKAERNTPIASETVFLADVKLNGDSSRAQSYGPACARIECE